MDVFGKLPDVIGNVMAEREKRARKPSDWRSLALAMRDAVLSGDPVEISRAGIAIGKAERGE